MIPGLMIGAGILVLIVTGVAAIRWRQPRQPHQPPRHRRGTDR